MKILYLAPTFDETNGWGRYSAGFLTQAKRHFGSENIIVPDPEKIRSKDIKVLTPLLVLGDAAALQSKAEEADVIHATAETLGPLAMMLGTRTGKPYIISSHGTYSDLDTYHWYARWLYKKAFAHACRILPVSTYTEQVVMKYFPEAKTKVVPGGYLPTDHRAETPAPSAKKRILSVGVLKRRKGFHTLIGAIELLKDHGMQVQCDIAGSKDDVKYVTELRRMILDASLAKDITLHGRVSDEKLHELYDSSDLFVLPAEHVGTAFEGLGLVYLEALSHGIPVIGSHDSGAEDVIYHGDNGLLVQPGDPEALADAIKLVFEDPKKWKAMSDAARPSVERFRWDHVGDAMANIYRTCPNT